MENKTIFIPDMETLKQKIREQVQATSSSSLYENLSERANIDHSYHTLFIRLKQEGFKGKVKAFFFQAARFLTLWQEQINHNIKELVLGLSRSIVQLNQRQDLQGSRITKINKNLSHLETESEKIDNKLSHLETESEKINKNLSTLGNFLKDQLGGHRRMMFQHQRSFELFLEAARNHFPEAFESQKFTMVTEDKKHFSDELYCAFENQFRGTRAEIKKRLSVYLPIVKSNFSPSEIRVLDIGCGRGEWLEILKEIEITAKGIDMNRAAVGQCVDYGLDAEESDALAFLKNLHESTYHAVTGFHIIEHLSFDQVLSFLDEIYRILIPGGVVIFETPNPANILVSAYDFYRDPSHIKPVHPDTARFLAEFRGFQHSTIQLVEHNGAQCQLVDFDSWCFDTIQHYVDIPRDYALIAYKQTADLQETINN